MKLHIITALALIATGVELWAVTITVSDLKIEELEAKTAFSRDGRYLAVSGRQLRVVDLQNNGKSSRILYSSVSDPQNSSVAFSPENLLAHGTYCAVKIWDVENCQVIKTYVSKGGGFVSHLAFNDDPLRPLLAAGTDDLGLTIWDFKSGNEVYHMRIPQGGRGLSDMKFSPDGRTLIAAPFESSVILVQIDE